MERHSRSIGFEAPKSTDFPENFEFFALIFQLDLPILKRRHALIEDEDFPESETYKGPPLSSYSKKSVENRLKKPEKSGKENIETVCRPSHGQEKNRGAM